MNINRAWLAPLAGSAVMLTASFSYGGDELCDVIGPDIITYKVADAFGSWDLEFYGLDGDVAGFAFGTTSGNPGDMEAEWARSGDGTKSPVIAQNIYRIKNDRFEQVGLSWLKHSFCAVSEAMCECQSTSCDTLGIGCADTYWADLNADAEGPRSEINPTTGDFVYPFFQSPCGSNTMRGKLQIRQDDRDPAMNSDAVYIIEGQYVAANADSDLFPNGDEYDYDLQFNNVSYRKIQFDTPTVTSSASENYLMVPAIEAWAEESGATVNQVWTPEADDNLGLMHVGYLVTDNGDGTWHYEYAVHNQNSHRAGRLFSVPVPSSATITNVDFHAPFYHSCELVQNGDWDHEIADGAITWSTTREEDDEWANALIWSSVYNFRFDANVGPGEVAAQIGFWRMGDADDPDSVDVLISGPQTNDCPADLNNDGSINVSDILNLIAAWNTAAGDIDGDGNTSVSDILILLDLFGTNC
jgi:hypothetical protein